MDARGFQLDTMSSTNPYRYNWWLEGSKKDHKYPIHATTVGNFCVPYVCTGVRGTYLVDPWDAMTGFWANQFIPMITDFLTNACLVTVLAQNTVDTTGPGTTDKQSITTYVVSNKNALVVVNKGVQWFKSLFTGVANPKRSQQIINAIGTGAQIASDTSRGVAAVDAMALFQQLVQAVQDLAHQDLDVSINYGSTIYSIRSKQVTQL
jgi:hypothetical protein